jgi:hypothetical protein
MKIEDRKKDDVWLSRKKGNRKYEEWRECVNVK